MPRTKAVRKRGVTQDSANNSTSSCPDFGQSGEKDVHMQIQEIKEHYRNISAQLQYEHNKQVSKVKQMFRLWNIALKENGLENKIVAELENEVDVCDSTNKENEYNNGIMPSSSKTKTTRSVRKRSNSVSSSQSTIKKNYVQRSASCERTRNIQLSGSKYKTPSNRNIPSMPMVTPKVNPNIPLAVLRRPRQGEFAMSISGSPLMVSSVTYDEMASVSVPLPDGRVLSILPTEGIAAASLNLDEETRKQLLKLRSNLTKCLGGQ